MTKEYIIKENTGTAFKGKSDHPNAPKYSGKCNVDGVIKEASFWIEKRKNGDEYLSFTFKKPWVKPKEEEKKEKESKYVDENEIESDDVPF